MAPNGVDVFDAVVGSVNGVMPYGLDEYGTTANVGTQDRLLIGTRLRTTNTLSDYDFGFLRLLGTP